MALDVLDDNLIVGDKIHWFDLKHYVTGALTGARLGVMSDEAEIVKALRRKMHDNDVKRFAEAKAAGKDAPEPLAYDEREALLLDLAVARLAGWEGLVRGGEPLPFSASEARALLQKAAWIRDAILAESGELANFIKPLPTPSEPTPGESSGSTGG
ncbi:hypothetical protein [Chromobacterium phragmitis]|uniref:hypothetical protein n=1 Tax=Chromobacterium phragmitis TaxID=2202141 RepID=UPI003877A14D